MSEIMFGQELTKLASKGQSGDWVGFLNALDSLLKNPVVQKIVDKRIAPQQTVMQQGAPLPQAPPTTIIKNKSKQTPAVSGDHGASKRKQTELASKQVNRGKPAPITDQLVIDHFLKKIKTPEGKKEIAEAIGKLKIVTGDKTLSEIQEMLRGDAVK